MKSILPVLLILPLQALLCGSAAAAYWTGGHGDLTVSYSSSPIPSFSYDWNVGTGGESATVDGVDIFDTRFSATALTPRIGPGTIPSPDPALTGGSTLRLIPQDGIDAGIVGSPFQGWRSAVPAGIFTGNQIRLVLTGGTGPGHVSLWEDGAFGTPDFRWSSANGFSPADSLTLGVGGHSHFNLAFSQPGDYQLAVLVQGTLTAGGSVSTPLSLNYQVVPEPGAPVLLAGLGLLALRRKRQAPPENSRIS